ncbi:MAG: hypothetical protein ACLPID_11275 [Beijerinckiaceae bacterium]
MRRDTGNLPNISFSPSAENYIRRFMDSAISAYPEAAAYALVISWAISSSFTARDTGKTTHTGAHFGLGATDPKDLEDECIAHLNNGLDVWVSLPEDLQSADRLAFDFVNDYFVLPDHPGYDSLPRPYVPD